MPCNCPDRRVQKDLIFKFKKSEATKTQTKSTKPKQTLLPQKRYGR